MKATYTGDRPVRSVQAEPPRTRKTTRNVPINSVSIRSQRLAARPEPESAAYFSASSEISSSSSESAASSKEDTFFAEDVSIVIYLPLLCNIGLVAHAYRIKSSNRCVT